MDLPNAWRYVCPYIIRKTTQQRDSAAATRPLTTTAKDIVPTTKPANCSTWFIWALCAKWNSSGIFAGNLSCVSSFQPTLHRAFPTPTQSQRLYAMTKQQTTMVGGASSVGIGHSPKRCPNIYESHMPSDCTKVSTTRAGGATCGFCSTTSGSSALVPSRSVGFVALGAGEATRWRHLASLMAAHCRASVSGGTVLADHCK
mmetsp:Transcript_28177/g.65124  ORF Transcript_28177/g.65124 Transcript_28177/m.65124 type:complete len:201 (+) Transcript_28177:331-933(+)